MLQPQRVRCEAEQPAPLQQASAAPQAAAAVLAGAAAAAGPPALLLLQELFLQAAGALQRVLVWVLALLQSVPALAAAAPVAGPQATQNQPSLMLADVAVPRCLLPLANWGAAWPASGWRRRSDNSQQYFPRLARHSACRLQNPANSWCGITVPGSCSHRVVLVGAQRALATAPLLEEQAVHLRLLLADTANFALWVQENGAGGNEEVRRRSAKTRASQEQQLADASLHSLTAGLLSLTCPPALTGSCLNGQKEPLLQRPRRKNEQSTVPRVSMAAQRQVLPLECCQSCLLLLVCPEFWTFVQRSADR